MSKKTRVVFALVASLFVGSAIAVRHIGHSTEINTDAMTSDEDDSRKEIIAKFGDLYYDTSECPESTTSGMAM